jgi:hypothetical protein
VDASGRVERPEESADVADQQLRGLQAVDEYAVSVSQ